MTEREAANAAPAEQGSRNLLMRVLAALVLVPVTIALAYAGGLPWAGLVTVAAIGLYVEWLMIVGLVHDMRVTAPGIVALALSGISLAVARLDAALLALGIGLLVVVLLSPQRRGWSAAGLLYAGIAEVASILVRHDAIHGFSALILVLLIVWVTDSGGYFAGRGIGGPKLWPRVSPKKTWAGAIGGLAASLAIGFGFAALNLGKMVPLLALAAFLSVISQLGDLFESAVKRRFGVKDSSQIIPGHGGLLDRLDGFVAAVAAAAILGFLRGGADGVGRGLMVW